MPALEDGLGKIHYEMRTSIPSKTLKRTTKKNGSTGTTENVMRVTRFDTHCWSELNKNSARIEK